MKNLSRALLLVVSLLVAVVTQAEGFDRLYVGHSGDFNGDGLLDLYLEHKPKLAAVSVDDITIPVPTTQTALKDFVLVNIAGGNYLLLSELTASQRSSMRDWPLVPLAVATEDINGDSVPDLWIGGIPTARQFEFGHVAVLAPSSAQSLQVITGEQARLYVVKIGDINGDAKLDLYVTGRPNRFVQDFILQQSSSSNFTLIAEPSASQRQAASLWRSSESIAVYREDLNFDGYFDFYIDNIDEEISGAENLLIYVQRNVGTKAAKVVPENSRFREDAEKIAEILINSHEQMVHLYSRACGPAVGAAMWPGYQIYDWFENHSPDVWYWNEYFRIYGAPTLANLWNGHPISCRPKLAYEHRPIQWVVVSAGDYLELGGAACTACTARAHSQLLGLGNVLVLDGAVVASRSASVARAAWILTGILIADDATVVGTVDDVLIPVIAIVGVAAEIIVIVSSPSNNPDAGVLPGTSRATDAGLYAPPPGFDPDDPNQDRSPTIKDSEQLGKNLERSGHQKPTPDAQAHHMVQTGNYPDANAARAILQRLGIGKNDAANGVWLPTKGNPGSTAQGHIGEGLHTNAYRAAVRRRIEAVLRDPSNPTLDEGPAVRQVLREIRQDLLSGNQFWLK